MRYLKFRSKGKYSVVEIKNDCVNIVCIERSKSSKFNDIPDDFISGNVTLDHRFQFVFYFKKVKHTQNTEDVFAQLIITGEYDPCTKNHYRSILRRFYRNYKRLNRDN